MASQRFAPVAAIQANYIVVAHGSPHRHRRGQNFFGLTWLSKLIERSVYGRDEARNLTGSDRMMSEIAPDNLRCQMRIDCVVVHGISHHNLLSNHYIAKMKL